MLRKPTLMNPGSQSKTLLEFGKIPFHMVKHKRTLTTTECGIVREYRETMQKIFHTQQNLREAILDKPHFSSVIFIFFSIKKQEHESSVYKLQSKVSMLICPQRY